MKSKVLNRLKRSFFYFNCISKSEARQLDCGLKMKPEFYYYAFSTPISICTRGLPKWFISEARDYFESNEALFDALYTAFKVYYGAGKDVAFVVNKATAHFDIEKEIQQNINSPSSWSLVEAEDSFAIIAPELKPLFSLNLQDGIDSVVFGKYSVVFGK